MEFIFIVLLYLIISPIVLCFIFVPMFKEIKISNGIRNQDMFSKNYLFQVNCSKYDFLRRLNIPNSYDALEYIFDNDTMTITFSKYNTRIPYTVFIKEFDGGCYIRLRKNVFIADRSNIPYFINEFMIKKFDAVLLSYDEYNDIIT